jgi:N-acetylglucosaminyl-diphospho-decaprenol L-rhamnosyltransferase
VSIRSPSFSIVIVTWNSGPELAPLLASIETWLPDRPEVVVVDNASRDEAASLVDAWSGRARVIRLDRNHGFGAANNVGVQAAQEDVVVMLNPDTVLVDASLRELAALARTTHALCGPELIAENGARQPSASPPPAGWEVLVAAVVPGALMPLRLRSRCEPWRSRESVAVGWLTGACVAGRRDILLRLGPFDERIHMYGEDMDLGVRARASGIASIFAPDVARVVHLGDRSASRRYADAGLAQSIANRRAVVRWRSGRAREWYDFASQVVYHGARYVVKRLLKRDVSRERQWLRTAARLMYARPAS